MRRWPVVVAILAGVVLLGGVAWAASPWILEVRDKMQGLPTEREIDAAREVLLSLPSFEEMQGTSDRILTEIVTALEDEFGPIEWLKDETEIGTGGRTSAEAKVGYPAGNESSRVRGPVAVDGPSTTRAIEIIESVAAKHGYTREGGIGEDVSGTQYINLHTDRGGYIHVVTADPKSGRWVIRVTTDIYMDQAAQDELRAEGY